jgi:FdrA protein
MSWNVRVVPNRYADSVRLMAIARDLRGRDGVRGCELAMGTPANLAVLRGLGVDVTASGSDLVIAVDAPDPERLLADAERELSAPPPGDGAAGASAPAPRTLDEAARAGSANLALVSVAGEYAALEAHRALSRGMHVFLFSDHVGVQDEIALKRRAERLGLVVMGPGCGTAMLGGVGLGFANVVRPGRVGIVAAAGTGAQEVACLIDAAGGGVSHIVGVGGRDLSEDVGGLMFRAGMAMLGGDDDTETLLLVSKPPAPEVVRSLAEAVPPGRRVVASFVGWDGGDAPFEVHDTLEAGAMAALGAAAPPVDDLRERVLARRDRRAGKRVVGLYSGGTLAEEAAMILRRELGDRDGAQVVLDLGDEEYTQGRPHPMISLDVRLAMIDDAIGGGDVGCLLLDVVLGHGAHPDPAGELAETVQRAARSATVIVRVCGTDADPQDASRQVSRLSEAGALIAPSNAAAARLAVEAVR